ncbi:MAG: hypothetical protein ACMXYL_05865 [Candidatus Woesearchaeota archaeon]
MKVPKQSLIDDLSSEQIAIIEQRMRPYQCSLNGFLNRTESLREVIEADAEVLRRHGITHKQVGDRLESLVGQASRQWDLAQIAGGRYGEAQRKGTLVEDYFRVAGKTFSGIQPCPYFDESHPAAVRFNRTLHTCGSGSRDYIIINEKRGTAIQFPELMSHLVRDHHFFEGSTPYRLNPEDAVNVLELKPGVDYTPKTETEILWQLGAATANPDMDFEGSKEIMNSARKTTDLAPGVKLYIAGDNGLIVAEEPFSLEEPLRIDGAEAYINILLAPGQNILYKTENEYVVG